MKTLLNYKLLLIIALVIFIIGCATTRKHWETAQSIDTISGYEEFLNKHPKNKLTNLARTRIEELHTKNDWEETKAIDSIESYDIFISQHPESQFTDKARSRLENLKITMDWNESKITNTISAYEVFIEKYPKSEFTEQAYVEMHWLKAREINTANVYKAYISLHPDSKYSGQAKFLETWIEAKNNDTISSYKEFLNVYPSSEFSDQAKSRIEVLKKDLAVWDKTKKRGTIRAYKQFISKYPQNTYVNKAKEIVDDYKSDIKGRDIIDALKNNKVDVEVTGSGIKDVSMKIKRQVNHKIKISVPVGTYFVCRGSAQNMVGRAEISIELDSDEWEYVSVPAACANRSRAIPDSDESFDIQASPHQAELKRLMPILHKAGASFGVEQAAVWIITDDADYGDLGTLVQRSMFQIYGGTRLIEEYEAAMAMKLCDKAGIDITKKSIWRDRNRIIEGLKNEKLRNWIQEKERRWE